MIYSLAATALVAALSVSAQTTHTVVVGQNGGLTYTPANITAAPNDIVSFVFTSKNHTVTQSTFAEPCTQLTNTTVTPNVVGVSSGYVPVPANSTEFPTWSFAVTDATPLWFFCLQGNHCQQGMVFSINAKPEKPHDAFVQAAKSSQQSVANPQTGGAASQSQSNGDSAPPPGDVASPSASSTNSYPQSPNGSPNPTQTDGGNAQSPSQSSPGAAIPNVKVPSMAVGALAVLLGVAL